MTDETEAEYDETAKCPPGYETATEYYDAGSGINAGVCCGCGLPRDDHVTVVRS